MKAFNIVALFPLTVCLFFAACESKSEEASVGTEDVDIAKDLDKLLSVETASGVAGFPAADATLEYTPDAKYPQTEVLTYSWENGRKRMSGSIEIATSDTVKFGWVRESALAAMEAKVTDPSFKDFMEKMDGVGDYAIWNSRDKQLIVLSGKKEFSVWVNVSADEAVNKAKSVELAKKLLGKI